MFGTISFSSFLLPHFLSHLFPFLPFALSSFASMLIIIVFFFVTGLIRARGPPAATLRPLLPLLGGLGAPAPLAGLLLQAGAGPGVGLVGGTPSRGTARAGRPGASLALLLPCWQLTCYLVKNSRGKLSFISPQNTRPDSPVPTLQES